MCAHTHNKLQTAHDYEHLGVNNDYLVASQHPLAMLYNDRWVRCECSAFAHAFPLEQRAVECNEHKKTGPRGHTPTAILLV